MIRRFRFPDYLTSVWPLAITLTGAFLFWLLVFGNPLGIVELRWLGELLKSRAAAGIAPPVDPHIVHLDIDRHQFESFSTIALEYQNAADIIRQATALGASVVVFDIIFSRGSQEESQPILDSIKEAERYGTHVVLAEALEPKPADGLAPDRIRSFPFRERLSEPSGLINARSDIDGVLRRYALVEPGPQGLEPSLALAAYLSWRGLNWKDVTFPNPRVARWPELSPDNKSIAPREIGVEPVLLNFRTAWSFRTSDVNAAKGVFIHYRLEQMQREYADAQNARSASRPVTKSLDDCVVAVSYIATGIGDVGTTPMGTNQPRVVSHLQALNDLIQSSFLHQTSRMTDACALLAVLLLVFFMKRCSGLVSLLVLWLGGVLLIIGLDAWFVYARNTVFSALFVTSLWTAVNLAEIVRRYTLEFVERLKLRTTMSFYFSPRVLERVLKNPGSTEPQEAELTLLLTDLRNSTPLAERLGANCFFALLNQVFEIQTRVVTGEDGNIEHFLGDQFLSYWGAPDPQPDGPDRALRAALTLTAEMDSFRDTLPVEIRQLFGYGVALHSGSALVGNKGSRLRLDYGVVGDLVNTAARIESLTKYYGVRVLVTRDTYAKLAHPPPARMLDCVAVKGKNVPTEILEVSHAPGKSNFHEVAKKYGEAFARYRAGQFDVAERLFTQVAETEGDSPSLVLARRCAQLRISPPAFWEGVFRLENK
ncbi:MAG: adenylate/guanylate cyclase domain-containing protein [Verrucomicrobia bacterium]|nr:adenylate/guanylate cyclase domain-containing protein [Verrucomicrobiota bacterium]